jgi:protein phosphatase
MLPEVQRNPAVLRIPPGALVVLCGPAASGKSRWARAWFRETEVVSSDRLRALVSDDEADQGASADAFRILAALVDARLRRGRLTVVDSTALAAAARSRLRLLARRRRRPVVLVAFDLSEAECRARDRDRKRRVGARVIRDHRRQFERALRALPREGYALVTVLDAAGTDAVRLVRGRRKYRLR